MKITSLRANVICLVLHKKGSRRLQKCLLTIVSSFEFEVTASVVEILDSQFEILDSRCSSCIQKALKVSLCCVTLKRVVTACNKISLQVLLNLKNLVLSATEILEYQLVCQNMLQIGLAYTVLS